MQEVTNDTRGYGTDNGTGCAVCSGPCYVKPGVLTGWDGKVYFCGNTRNWIWSCDHCRHEFHTSVEPYSGSKVFCPNCGGY